MALPLFSVLSDTSDLTDAEIRKYAQLHPKSKLAKFLNALKESNSSPTGLFGSPDGQSIASADNRYDGYIIKWKPGTTDNQRLREQRQSGYVVRDRFQDEGDEADDRDDKSYEVIDTRGSISEEQLARQLASQRQVASIEKNWIYTAQQLTLNDTYASQLWGLSSGTGINATTFFTSADWDTYANGPDVYTVVVDEGIFNTHTDLIGRIGNPGEINGRTGVDDDGNGYVDDIYGWDFDANNNSIFDSYQDDHGSHVYGTIGASAGNGTGVVGVSPLTKAIGAKFLGTRGGTTANAIRALNYVADLKANRNVNIAAVNCSWGGGGFSQELYNAISNLNQLGILVICAAGNSGSITGMYPAAYDLPNIISVASIDQNGSKSSFSNYGTSWVHLAAPGGSIISTIPSTSRTRPSSTYASYSGTSMAAPHVTGIVATLAKMFPLKTHLEIKDAVLKSVTKTSSLQGLVSTGGYANMTAAINLLRGDTTASPTTPTVLATSNITTENEANETINNIITVTLRGEANSTANYSIRGDVTSADFTSGNMSGSINLGTNGEATYTWTISEDNLTEGPEAFQLFLNNSTLPALEIVISDTSLSPDTAPPANATDNPNNTELWGTAGSDPNLVASATQLRASGVTQAGPDTGSGTIDVVTGNSAQSMTYILGDSRGMFYDDMNSRSIGNGDYLRITNLKAGDTLQLSSGSYLYSTNSTTQTVTLYRDTTGNGRLDTGTRRTDEMIAEFVGAGTFFSAVNIVYV